MKKPFAVLIALAAVLLVGGTAFAAVALPSGKEVKFQGTIQTQEADEVLFPIIYLHGNGSGSANELGQFTLHFEGIVHNDSAGVGTAVEGAHYIAENGDILFATGTGLGVPTTTPGVNSIVETYTITGGTGRYEGASGSFTVERVVSLQTFASTGTVKGTIKLQKP